MKCASASCHAANTLLARYSTFPARTKIIQRPQRLIDRHIRIGPMDVINIDPLGLQPFERLLDFPHDVPARVPRIIDRR